MAVPAKASIASGRREEGESSREISTSIGPCMIPPISMAGNYSPEPAGCKQWILRTSVLRTAWMLVRLLLLDPPGPPRRYHRQAKKEHQRPFGASTGPITVEKIGSLLRLSRASRAESVRVAALVPCWTGKTGLEQAQKRTLSTKPLEKTAEWRTPTRSQD